ncbi:pro-neuregulin-3, membrane-bound isoform isoform X1 [Pygocentrus nattereri]|uniref:pro-neuregulin-3, membrane-bound isoform isoform X1 n=1 Tax=Pygocentrus nattereri TaxID=42514 RepID=UPI000814508E|nr:pro-neuregulin-3, membrane-bound isoform isoform X1 [Pygocentrus nattereri]
MSERTALGATMETMTLEEPGGEQASPRAPGPLRCGPCAVWPRQQQTWLCVVPLLMGFVGLGLSLMLLKWIVVGSVQDYVPPDLVDAKGIGQDPIFLSKPSSLPKGPDAPSASTAVPANTMGPGSAADGTSAVQRTQAGPPSNHTASSSSSSSGGRAVGAVGGGSGNQAPHLHNRVGTKANGTASTRPAMPGGKEVTPRSTTVRKPSGAAGGRNAHPSSRAGPLSPTSITTTTTATTSTTTAKSTTTTRMAPPTTSTPTAPARPTQRLNHGRSSKGPSTKPTRPHHRFRTLAPTTPTVRSEFFKPCQDSQELAFCLNEGECFIIETVAGVHRHCRCKEGYRGLRCDQFVPKTDSILSDPTDELGIEFMESGETYQRQILSIFSIAMGISLLGVACMALYCRNKRQREKHRAHLTEMRNLRDCSVNALRLMSKSSSRTECGLQHQKCCKAHGSSPTSGRGTVHSSSKLSAANQSRSLSMGKRHRSCSFSSSPALKQKISNHRSVPRWTPPISRAGHHLIGGSKDSIHSYKHLQELESTDVPSESLRRCQSHTDGNQHSRSYLNMQTVASAPSRGRLAYADVPCTRLDQGTAFPRPSHRACSVPIIPSVQASDLGDRSVDGGSTMLLYKSGVFASHKLINPETEAETLSLANSSQSLAGLTVAQGSHGLTCSESALVVGQTKHKSLVTYTTALGAGTDSSRAKTVISTTILASSSLSKSTGKLERRPVRSACGGTPREEHGAGLQTSFLKGEKDFHLSGELRGVSCLTPPKS